MLKYFVVFVVFLAVIAGGFFLLNSYIYDEKQGGVEDYKQITVVIDGRSVVLGTEGTAFFGNEAKGDINDDTIVDRAFIITQQTGGSGTFYYVVAALQNSDNRYVGTNAVLLGDRIAPQTTEIRNSIVITNYADRGPREPFTTPPSMGKSLYAYYDGEQLVAEKPTALFYYNPTLDTDAKGAILCSAKGMVPILRFVPQASVETAVRALLQGKLSDGERSRGITTEFPLSGVSLRSARVSDGVAILEFDDPQFTTSGGSCRVAILRAQIEATARQFEGVTEVRMLPNEVFQP